MSVLTARSRRIGLVVALVLALGAAAGVTALALSSGRHPHSVGGAEKTLAAAISANPRLTEWDLPNSDRPRVPGELCTMTYAPTGYGGTYIAATLTKPGALVGHAMSLDGPQSTTFQVKAGDEGFVFNLPPNKITAVSAQLILADGTTHDCSAEPFRP